MNWRDGVPKSLNILEISVGTVLANPWATITDRIMKG
jgi:hypothetical protein